MKLPLCKMINSDGFWMFERAVATLDYELHPEAKDAIDTDLKLALTTKISRERIGAEVGVLLHK